MLVRPAAAAALLLAAPRLASSMACQPAYSSGTSYSGGDVVSATEIVPCSPAGVGTCPASGMVTETFNFECNTGPTAAFCSQSGFVPGGQYSGSAWTRETAPCTGTATPAVATPSPTPALWAGGGCPKAYVAGTDYAAADVVSVVGASFTTVYQCAAEPANQFCGQSGFAPGGQFSDSAWTALGSCAGTIAPTGSPSFDSLADAGGCPGAFDDGEAYEGGDAVSVDGLVYQCKAGAQGLFCPQIGFEPGTAQFWEQAWTLVGFCSGTIAPTGSPSFDTLADVGGCPGAFDEGDEYEPGDKVSRDGLVYECKAEPLGRHCPQAGYEPGVSISAAPGAPTVEYWKEAWNVIGYCSGTITPTTSPNYVALANVGGCPDGWVTGAFVYEEGDKVSDGTLVYECKAWPFSAHCGQAGYEPNTNPATPDAWKDAWTVVGYCSGSIGPTSSPAFNPATSIGTCPDAWERGSNVAYEEGDMVSVTVSQMPLRQVAYTCKAWPFSGFCGQFSPDEFGGSQGWVLAGSCDGSIGPTASPSFDALAFQAGGCPEEWSATKTDYEAGDQVAYSVSTSPARRIVFQCRTWPNNGYCNQGSGFEPTTKFSNLAWTELGYCDGSMAPTTSPTMYAGTCQFNQCRTTKQSCTAGSAGCSCTAGQAQTSACKVDVETCTMVDVDPWSNSVAYEADDVVRVVRKQFKCKPWPNSLWCPNAAYMPMLEDNGVWPRAWIALDDDCM